MNLIEIGIYLGCLIAGFSLFWFLSRQKLISDIKNKESKSEGIIASAKSRANKIIKDTEKKAKNYKENKSFLKIQTVGCTLSCTVNRRCL